MPCHVIRARCAGAQEDRDARHTDHTAGRGTGADLFVGDVAAVFHQRQRIGVAEDDRLGRGGHDVQAALAPGVRAVHQHAGRVDGRDNFFAQRCQALFDVMATARNAVVSVIGQVHLPHTKASVQRHHLGLLEQWHGAFEVEADCQFSFGGRLFDVLHRGRQHIPFRMRCDVGAKAGDDGHHLRQWVHVHADIDRHVVDAGCVQPVYRREVGLWVQGQAGMGFPVDHLHLLEESLSRTGGSYKAEKSGSEIGGQSPISFGLVCLRQYGCPELGSDPDLSLAMVAAR